MAEVEIARRRIHPELDPERTAFGKLGRKLGRRDDLGCIPAQLNGGFAGFVLVEYQSRKLLSDRRTAAGGRRAISLSSSFRRACSSVRHLRIPWGPRHQSRYRD